MKKIFSLIPTLLLYSIVAQSQYVVIPDANFRSFLKANFPSCINISERLDTTCSEILSQTNLDCSSNWIQNLEGIQYFKSLKTLICENNQLTTLPTLPASLLFLNCRANRLTSLPTLPNTMDYLNCANNNLTSLPVLPYSLTSLKCSQNQILTLPPTLPNGLQALVCAYNPITSLPTLPPELIELNFDVTLISSLPPLPSTLKYFFCDSTHLSTLPDLPGSLLNLGCGFNGYSCLPQLPSSLQELYIDSASKINCIPNLVSGLTVFAIKSFEDDQFAIRNLPVCNSENNVNGCTIYQNYIDFCPASSSGTITSNIIGVNYQWQVDTCSRSGTGCYYSLIGQNGYNNANTATLNFINISSQSTGFKYRCMVDGNYSDEHVLRFTNIWTGAVNTQWENPANWSCNNVPDQYTDVLISNGNVVVNSNVSVRSLKLSATGNVIVNTGKNVTIKSNY